MLTSLTRKLAATIIVASFLLSPGSAPAATTSDGCSEQYNILSFHVTAKPGRPVYLESEKAIIHVKVTRPAHEDPGNNGIEIDPPDSEPAADIYVGIAFVVGNSYLFGFGVTDEKGKADVEIEIDEGTDSGEADVNIYAWKDLVSTPCLTIREYGHRYYEDMFRIV